MIGALAQMNGIKVFVNQFHPKEFSHFEARKYQSHPLIHWLARLLPFDPYSWHFQVPVMKDKPPLFIGDKMFCSKDQFDQLKAETTPSILRP